MVSYLLYKCYRSLSFIGEPEYFEGSNFRGFQGCFVNLENFILEIDYNIIIVAPLICEPRKFNHENFHLKQNLLNLKNFNP